MKELCVSQYPRYPILSFFPVLIQLFFILYFNPTNLWIRLRETILSLTLLFSSFSSSSIFEHISPLLFFLSFPYGIYIYIYIYNKLKKENAQLHRENSRDIPNEKLIHYTVFFFYFYFRLWNNWLKCITWTFFQLWKIFQYFSICVH